MRSQRSRSFRAIENLRARAIPRQSRYAYSATACRKTSARASSRPPRDAPIEERRDVIAEDALLLRCAEESAVAAHVIEALLVRAEALHIGHVGAPDELPGAETIAHATDQLLRLRVGVVPDAAPGNREHDFEEQIVAAIDFERLVRDLPFPAA